MIQAYYATLLRLFLRERRKTIHYYCVSQIIFIKADPLTKLMFFCSDDTFLSTAA